MLISDWSSDVCSSDLPLLIDQARCAQPQEVHALARRLVQALRGKRKGGGVESLIQEFSLSSQEGVALMCLAEALLRIPDRATRDALIRDKISHGEIGRASCRERVCQYV